MSVSSVSFHALCYFRNPNPGAGRKSRCQNVATQLVIVDGLPLKLCQKHADAVREKSYTVVSTIQGIRFREFMKAFEFTKVEAPIVEE